MQYNAVLIKVMENKMARKREVILDQDEDIAAYEHHLQGKFIRVFVGFGVNTPDGFQFSEGQNYEQITIQTEAYDNLLAATDTKPAGVFRKEDLWPIVDIARQNVLTEREKAAKASNKSLKPVPDSTVASDEETSSDSAQ